MIYLRYIDNFKKILINSVEYSEIIEEDVTEAIKMHYKKGGYSVEDKENLYIIKDGKWLPFDENLLEDNTEIIYSKVVIPQNAIQFARQDGLVFFFQTSEKCHLFFPHVHVEYSGETIQIALSDYHCEGSFKNPSKQKQAVKYVKKNKKNLLKEWNRIMKG